MSTTPNLAVVDREWREPFLWIMLTLVVTVTLSVLMLSLMKEGGDAS